MYFNEDYIIKRCFEYIGDYSEEIAYYDSLKIKLPALPDSISNFFYTDNDHYCFMSDILVNHLNWSTDNFNDYIRIINNKCFLKNEFIKQYFPDATIEQLQALSGKGEPKAVYDLISSLQMPIDFCYRYKYTLDLFDSLADDLVKWLTRVNFEVRKLHNEHQPKLKAFIEQMNEKSIKKLAIMHSVDEYCISSAYGAVTLFYPMICFHTTNQVMTLVLGLKFEEALDFMWNYKHVTIYSASKILADPTKAQIMELFFTQQSFSVPDIMKELHLSKSTVVHHINLLLEEQMIVMTSVKNRTFYYKVNHPYFDKIMQAVDDLKARAQGVEKSNKTSR